jgi:6-phosphogluconate dehydrogenase
MQIGLIGLGKMGYNLALNMHNHGHAVMAFDLNPSLMDSISQQGMRTFSSIDALTTSF